MGIGTMLPVAEGSHFGDLPRYSDMREMTVLAEQLGYDAVWIADHLVLQEDPPDGNKRGVWEGWMTLSALAEATSTIQLGVFVTCVGWRNPGLIAKMAETLDEVSDGRFILGLGAGWHQPEYDMFGYPWDHRVSRFEDAINIVQPLLNRGFVDYEGEYSSARDLPNIPRGPRGDEGGPPILVGTKGPRMMRLTAQFADAYNSCWHREPSTLIPHLEALDAACIDVGRDPATMVKTAGTNVELTGCTGTRADRMIGDADSLAEQIDAFRSIGLRHWMAGMDPCTPASLEEFARTIEILDASEARSAHGADKKT